MENKIPPQVVIGEKMLSAHPELEKILPKEKTEEEKKIEVIHSKDIDKNKIVVPDIFFWVDYDFFEKPVIMTAAFKYKMFLLDPPLYSPYSKEYNNINKTSFSCK